jgi:cysteine desulfurase
LEVTPAPHPDAGLLDVAHLARALRPDTVLVTVMLANNEIGVIQPLAEIARVCREHGVLLHCDATQAVGKLPVDVNELGVDLMSFSAHKIYGPKGIGALYVRRDPPVVLQPQIDGGGQERGRRSGTLNVPGIVGFAKALELCLAELPTEAQRLAALRDRLFDRLKAALPQIVLNGPSLDEPAMRLPGNLNVSIEGVDGEALLAALREVAVSSGSACTSADPEPSHVLRALGVREDLARASLRFGLGRFTTEDEIEFAAEYVARQVWGLQAQEV